MHSENNNYGTVVVGGKKLPSDMPTEAELKARHSFPSPNDNRHIDKFIKATKH
ncbi:DUF2737 family protein [Cedecea colo]|uniref:DUF2737 family protein n=1 Tax=Cedecea colo TaxID=2552946 RepID=A0ABX0VK65_9ENTR|nr:DUF2737 family protein [Cedecea colo]